MSNNKNKLVVARVNCCMFVTICPSIVTRFYTCEREDKVRKKRRSLIDLAGQSAMLWPGPNEKRFFVDALSHLIAFILSILHSIPREIKYTHTHGTQYLDSTCQTT
jgi:hypothetical protein